MQGKVYQLNMKHPMPNQRGLPKNKVNYINITFNGAKGDYNKFRQEKRKGTKDRALLIMPLEMITILNEEGWTIHSGDLGENITTEGIPYNNFTPQQIYQIGQAQIQISEPCTPCKNLQLIPIIGGQRVKEFMQTIKGRRGWYASVLKEGIIYPNDLVNRIE